MRVHSSERKAKRSLQSGSAVVGPVAGITGATSNTDSSDATGDIGEGSRIAALGLTQTPVFEIPDYKSVAAQIFGLAS